MPRVTAGQLRRPQSPLSRLNRGARKLGLGIEQPCNRALEFQTCLLQAHLLVAPPLWPMRPDAVLLLTQPTGMWTLSCVIRVGCRSFGVLQ